MTWCNNSVVVAVDDSRSSALEKVTPPPPPPPPTTTTTTTTTQPSSNDIPTMACPSCGHHIQLLYDHQAGGINDLPGLPAGVKFDPSDQEILEHLEAKVLSDTRKLHPLIDEFIPTLEGENGICYTHPEKLPGVSKDGLIRHFFHRPSKAYTTGTRKRRKVHTDADGGETRWHKTGKTRPVFAVGGAVKGFKKILVLYTNYGRQRKPEKTNWVMHQYHLGNNEEEKDGELVVSKVFYQTQPRQCGGGSSSIIKDSSSLDDGRLMRTNRGGGNVGSYVKNAAIVEYYNNHHPSNSNFISYDDENEVRSNERECCSPQLIPNLGVQGNDDGSSFIRLASNTSKGKLT